ncbi:MAG: hypothetical protein GX434_15500 [Peptococcaceae bacterium]|nr:hypothetical protein [Peptococcaceae bacterium]
MHYFQIGQYKGLEILPQTIFTEAELDTAVIETIFKMFDQWSKSNKAVEKGDEVAVSVYATYDALPVPELCTSHIKYKVGDPKIFAEFNHVIGKKKEEHFDMKIDFPKNIPDQKVAGKTINFTATVLEVWPSKQMQITDSIARKLDPEVTGIDSLRAKVRNSIMSRSQQIIRENNLHAVLDAIIEKATYKLDEDELANTTQQIIKEALQSNITFPNIPTNDVLTEDNLDSYFYEDCSNLAKQQILMDLVFNELVRRENIFISEQELEEEKKQLLIEMKAETLRERLLEEKLANLLLQWNMKKVD